MPQRIGILCIQTAYPSFYQHPEILQFRHRTLAHIHGEETWFLDDLPKANAIGLCSLNHLTNRRVANTSGWIVDDALEGLLIVRVGNQTEIGYHILDFLSLIERKTAIDTVRNIVFPHLFLKRTALGVSAIENGKVTPVAVILPSESLDILRYDHCLFLIRVGRL